MKPSISSNGKDPPTSKKRQNNFKREDRARML